MNRSESEQCDSYVANNFLTKYLDLFGTFESLLEFPRYLRWERLQRYSRIKMQPSVTKCDHLLSHAAMPFTSKSMSLRNGRFGFFGQLFFLHPYPPISHTLSFISRLIPHAFSSPPTIAPQSKFLYLASQPKATFFSLGP